MDIKESFIVHGENLVKKIKELIQEGNVRKITISDKSGKELMTFPLTVGIVGAVLAPILAAVGALAALIGECSITVERAEPAAASEEKHAEAAATATNEEKPKETENPENKS